MQEITLHALPLNGEEPWTIEKFLYQSEAVSRSAAATLHRKSLMVEEAVEEILLLVKNAAKQFETNETKEFDNMMAAPPEKSVEIDSTATGSQSQDWSQVYQCFENPHILVHGGSGIPKGIKELVRNAANEMRRYYSRKVIDVLIKVTRSSLDIIRKKFAAPETPEEEADEPVFLINAILNVPNITLNPKIEQIQEALNAAGKFVTGNWKINKYWTEF